MKSKYTKSLERAGAEIRWIELDEIDNAVNLSLDCDGLLLPGGADIEPSLYGRNREEKCGKPNELRDKFEFEIYKAFIKTGKPLLCICRGFQLLNVACGGTLYQDISEIKKCNHSDFIKRSKHIHNVDIKENTLLYNIFKKETVAVNSLHHQAVEKIGENLTVCAVSEDGFAEALELNNHPFCVGVQWHPEHLSKKDPLQQKLFDDFIKKCISQKEKQMQK